MPYTSLRRSLLALALLPVMTGATATPAGAVSPGGDTGVRDASGGSTSAQTEQTLAVDPTNPANVAIGFISGLSISHDGGMTWKLSGLTCTGDNNPAFDEGGTALFECDNNGPGVFRSQDAGDHWGSPVTAVSGSDNNGDIADRPWLVRGAGKGKVYLGYESFFTTPIGWVFVKGSSDAGASWPGPAHRVDDAASTNIYPAAQDPREMPAVGGDGTLYLAYASGHQPFTVPDFLPTTIVVARSHDGGATFDRSAAAPNISRTNAPEEETEAISWLAADPSPLRGNHVALAWADKRSGESRVLVVSSIDGGITWSKHVDVADDAPGTGNSHDHAVLSFGPDGRLFAVWRDRRCCGGGWNSNYEIFARAFTLGATGVTPAGGSVRVTDSPQSPNPVSNLNEYIGAVAGAEGLSVAWNQQRNGTAGATFRRLPLSTVVPLVRGERAAQSSMLPVTGRTASAAGILAALGVALMVLLATALAKLRP
ncbi:MAG: sialidase family protein [Candidatus Dormibacteria bacterium]